MPNLNKVILIGNLTKDPELKYTGAGAAVCNLRMAINRKYKVKEEYKEDVCFLTVVVWRQQAESCAEYLKKGDPVCVEGRLQSRTWEKDDKTKQTVVEVVAERVVFLTKKDGPVVEDHSEPQPTPTTDEEIPF